MDLDDGNRHVFDRLGGPSAAPADSSKYQKVCNHWRAGKCTHFPCPFLHRELPHPSGRATAATANRSGAPKRFADDSLVSENPFTPKPSLIRYWNKETRSKIPKTHFLLSKVSPLTAVDSASFSKLAAQDDLASRLPSFCSSVKLFCSLHHCHLQNDHIHRRRSNQRRIRNLRRRWAHRH